ncbi:uncharacterized protein GJ701_005476 isoform 1-T1 [Geothlypis trichas]
MAFSTWSCRCCPGGKTIPLLLRGLAGWGSLSSRFCFPALSSSPLAAAAPPPGGGGGARRKMGGVTFHPPRLPRELAVRYVLIHRREQDRGTRTELFGPGSGSFPERWRSCGSPGAAAAAAAAWRAAPPAPHSHPRRYSQSERGVLRAAACGCAPPPPRRAPPAPRRPSLLRAVLPARLHPGGAPRQPPSARAPLPSPRPPARSPLVARGAHARRAARALPGAGRSWSAAGRGQPALPAMFGNLNARSRPHPPPGRAAGPPPRRRGQGAHAQSSSSWSSWCDPSDRMTQFL